jgi:hypothetical protein
VTQQIQVKRGTDAARKTTLGTPAAGEPIFTTDTKALFLGDGATAGACPASKPSSVMQVTTSLTTDINAAATDNLIEWDTQLVTWGSDVTHSTGTNPSRFTIRAAGYYEIAASVSINAAGSSAVRYNGFLRCRLNGTTDFGPVSSCGYIRDTTAHDNSSLHLSTFVYQFSGSDYFELKIDRESSVTAAVNLTANFSYLYIRRIA